MPPTIAPPMLLTDMRALSNSSLVAVYLWLAIAKAVSHCPGRLKLFDAAKMRGAHTHIMPASSCFSRLTVARSGETWHVTNELLVSDFTVHFTGTPTPGVCVSLHQCFPRSAVRRSAAYQIVVGGQTAPQTVVCPVLGTTTKNSIGPIPIPPNTGKYWPIPQYRYRSNPKQYSWNCIVFIACFVCDDCWWGYLLIIICRLFLDVHASWKWPTTVSQKKSANFYPTVLSGICYGL